MPRTTRLSIYVKLGGKRRKISLNNFDRALNWLADTVITDAKNILAEQDKVVTGMLQQSLQYDIVETDEGVVINYTGAVPYWDFVEQGVKGAASSNKAPNSEYQFGSGTGPKGTLRPAIRKWITDRGISNAKWRDKSGRFLSYDAMSRRISRSVYLTGIKPSNYYTLAIDKGWSRKTQKLSKAFGKDLEVFLDSEFGKEYTIEIVF